MPQHSLLFFHSLEEPYQMALLHLLASDRPPLFAEDIDSPKNGFAKELISSCCCQNSLVFCTDLLHTIYNLKKQKNCKQQMNSAESKQMIFNLNDTEILQKKKINKK